MQRRLDLSELKALSVAARSRILEASSDILGDVHKTVRLERAITPHNRTSKYNGGRERVANGEIED